MTYLLRGYIKLAVCKGGEIDKGDVEAKETKSVARADQQKLWVPKQLEVGHGREDGEDALLVLLLLPLLLGLLLLLHNPDQRVPWHHDAAPSSQRDETLSV